MFQVSGFKSFFLFFSLFLLILPSAPAQAAAIRAGDDLTISKKVADGLYMGGGNLTINAKIEGDLIAAGGKITVNERVKGDIIAVAGQIVINSPVEGAVRVASGSLVTRDKIQKDLIAFSGDVSQSKKGKIGKDLLLFAGRAKLKGEVKRDIKGGTGELHLFAPVGGDVKIQVGKLLLGKEAQIKGNLTYTSNQKAQINEDQIGGFVRQIFPKEPSLLSRLGAWLFSFGRIASVGTVVVLLFPRLMDSAIENLGNRFWASLGWGALSLLVLPVAAFFFALTTLSLGLPLSLILIGLYLISIYVSSIFVAAFVGNRLIQGVKGERNPSPIWSMLIGLFILSVLGVLPYIGFLIKIAVLLSGLGVLLITERNFYQKAREAELI